MSLSTCFSLRNTRSRAALEHQHDVEMEHSEVRDLLEELREEGMMKYHLGEFGEFALADEG